MCVSVLLGYKLLRLRRSGIFEPPIGVLDLLAVVVVDDQTEMVLGHQPEEIVLKLEGDDELYLPGILGEFRVPVRRFFE